MLAVNGQKLNLKDREQAIVRDYIKKTDFLKSQAKSYTFRFPDNVGLKADPRDPDSRDEQPAGYMFKNFQPYDFGPETVEMQYYETSRVDEKGVTTFLPRYQNIKGEITLDVNTKIDLIYFLIYVSPYCKLNEQFPGQNKIRRHTYYVIYDRISEVSKEVEQEEKLAEVKTLIFSKKNGIPPDMLREIASGYGFRVKDVSDDDVKKLVRDHVLRRKNGVYQWAVIDEFLASPTKQEFLQISATVQKALDLGIIEFTPGAGKTRKGHWSYTSGDKVVICDVPVTVKSRDAIVDHLDRYKDKADELRNVVQAAAQ